MLLRISHLPLGSFVWSKPLLSIVAVLSIGSGAIKAEALSSPSPWQDIVLRSDSKPTPDPGPGLIPPSNDGPVATWSGEKGNHIEFQPPELPGAKGLDFSIYYSAVRPTLLQLTVLNKARERIACIDLFPDGHGWRRVEINFAEDTLAPSETKDKSPAFLLLEIKSGPPVILGFKKPKWLLKPGYRRTPDFHCPSIYGQRSDSYANYMREWLAAFQNPEKNGSGPVTDDLERVAQHYDRWALGSADMDSPLGRAIATTQAEWIEKARKTVARIGLKRQGAVIRPAGGMLPKTNDILFLLTPLAIAWRQTHEPSLLDDLWLLLDFLEQQGFGACNPGDPLADTMPFARLKLAGYAHALALLREPLIATGRVFQARRTLRWQARIGEWDGDHRFEVNADVLRGEALPRFVYCLLTPDPAVRSWEYGRLSAWLNDCMAIKANLQGLVKPDFTVNHHNNTYLVEYGPHALLAAATLANFLETTPWALSVDAKATIESCGDALLDISRGFSVPIGTRGRFPGGNRSMTENLPLYITLASRPAFSGRHAGSARELMTAMGSDEVADLLSKKSIKQSLLWMNSLGIAELADKINQSDVAPTVRSGFKAFNWAAVSVAKKAQWSASITGFSKWVFDYEAGNAPNIENDWGRYLRYGTVELWSGQDPYDEASSGWTIKAGWDWSLIPGATTLRLPTDKLSIAQATGRRHRNFSDSVFCAGLAGPDGVGVFGFDLQDRAFAGKLRARKSVLATGRSILCLGSGISSTLPDVSVVTTLFQFGKKEAPRETLPAADVALDGITATSRVFRDPAGNEFAVLGAGKLVRRQGIQEGPDPSGRINRGIYDTLWIDHGAQPTEAGYAYVIRPSTEPKADVFEIVERSTAAHIVHLPDLNLRVYVLFAPSLDPDKLSADRPCLIWEKELGGDRKELRVCDPDLNFPNGYNIDAVSSEESKPTTVRLSVPGHWTLAAGVKGVVVERQASATLVSVTCHKGASVTIQLIKS